MVSTSAVSYTHLDVYKKQVVLRAVSSSDGINANAVRMPYDLLERVVRRMTSEIPGVGRVVYDITGCPSAAIEWW